nr:MAG: major capsid protein [Microviridae sp.]
MTHDVNTTADFGHCQPTLLHPVIPNTHVSLKSSSFVRLAPMPQPSFARVQMRTYSKFVPLDELFLAFDFMQSQQSVTSAIKSYIPTSADYMTMGEIFSLFAALNNYTWRNGSAYEPLAVMTAFYQVNEQTMEEFVPVSTDQFALLEEGVFDAALQGSLLSFLPDGSRYRSVSLGNDYSHFMQPLQYGYFLAKNEDYEVPHSVRYMANQKIDNADFLMRVSLPLEDSEGLATPHDVCITFHLTHSGRRFFKVLYGCGVNFGSASEKFPLYNFFAYYKAWFDTFSPQRDVQWKMTPAFKLIHSYYDTNLRSIAYLVNTTYGIGDAICDFFLSLPLCCYSLDLDPITVAQPKPVMSEFGSNGQLSFPSQDDTNDIVNISGSLHGTYPFETQSADNAITLRWLQKLLPFVNKNSVIGRRVHEYMRVHFGTSTDRIDYTFGTDINTIQISDVLNQSSPQIGIDGQPLSGDLGEYAGFGKGGDEGNKHDFDVPKHGLIVQFVCMIPFGGYSQAVGSSLAVERFDFYQHEFDSLGMEAMPYSRVMASCDVMNKQNDTNSTFGFRPRYFDYKYKNNLRNGGFKFRGQRGEYLPYCLDRFFTENDIQVQKGAVYSGTGECLKLVDILPSAVVCNENLRFIGQKEEFGNYDRLFVDSLGVQDNFIIHMVQDYKIHAPMLPISDSFDTFDNEGLKDDNHTVSIQHS